MSQPETGALITEYTAQRRRPPHDRRGCGAPGTKTIRELHLALNSGIPLVDPAGGFFFVFQTGEPVFRKYDAAGQLVFERRIAGTRDRCPDRRPADDLAAAADRAKASCRWSRRRSAPRRSIPTDSSGSPSPSRILYVFDRDGDKVRTVQLRGAGIMAPTSLFFGRHGRLLVTPGLYEFTP